MTSTMRSPRDDKISLLHSCLNEINTISRITHERFDISSPIYTQGCILAQYIYRLSFKVKGKITRSPVKKGRSNIEMAVTSLIFKLER